jgi:hypothetical protein
MRRIPLLTAVFLLLTLTPPARCDSLGSNGATKSAAAPAQASAPTSVMGLTASVIVGPGKDRNVFSLPETESLRPYCLTLLARIKDHWFKTMPMDVMLGDKGKVSVEFEIRRDGRISYDSPIVETGSGDELLRRVAIKAVRASAPFDPLPQDYRSPTL